MNPQFSAMDYTQPYETPRLKGEKKNIGRTVVQPLYLGQNSAAIPRKRGLPKEFFYENELVSMLRSDGRRTIGKIGKIYPNGINVICESCIIQGISSADVPNRISKLMDAFYLVDGPSSVTRIAGSGAVRVGGTTLHPVQVGQESGGLPKLAGLPWEYFYVGEPVSLTFAHGKRIVVVTFVSPAEMPPSQATLVVKDSYERSHTISAADVPKYVCKLIGSFFVAHGSSAADTIANQPSSTQAPAKPTVAVVKRQVNNFFKWHDKQRTLRVFAKHATKPDRNLGDATFLDKEGLRKALDELEIHADGVDIDRIFQTMDANNDGVLDAEELRRALMPPAPVRAWADSLDLPGLLAHTLPPQRDSGVDPVRAIASLSDSDIKAVASSFRESLETHLRAQVERIRRAFEALDRRTNESENEKFNMTQIDKSGTLDDFHAGLQGRIGSCHLDFKEGMTLEHCVSKVGEVDFTTPNLNITTTPKAEWQIVLRERACPPDQMQEGRMIPDIETLLALPLSVKAKLTPPEVIGVVLYTGPMYHVYNTILRQNPAPMFEVYRKANNLFSTTIFVIVSAVMKISRVTRLPEGLPLYRGLGGMALPEQFYKGDANGLKGFVEWGFMSTTSKKDVAISYSGVRDKKPLPALLSLRVSTVDRGACIREYSQYKDEVEYLYVPCSFLQQDGCEHIEVVEGEDGTDECCAVTVFPVKVNANLKTMTIEELKGQKKAMHLAAFKYLIHEIEAKLLKMADEGKAAVRLESDKTKDGHHSVEGFLGRMVEQCREVLARHESVSEDEYSKHAVHQSLVLEMVDVKAMAMSKLEEWLDNKNASFIRFRWNAALRTVQRRWIAYLERKFEACSAEEKISLAIRLCKAKKLIVESVDEKNELGETRIMAAAAEGFSRKNLGLLVQAGADVNGARTDGVTSVWLAAQFGHSECIKSLELLKANISQAANDGATPVYIAAQNGNHECIRVLQELKADVTVGDKKKVTPVHQAAMNGQVECLRVLDELGADLKAKDDDERSPWDVANAEGRSELEQLVQRHSGCNSPFHANSVSKADVSKQQRDLIISTGDISDVDGFLALAEYAKMGADVVFVMNYPAHIAVKEDQVTDVDNDVAYEQRNPGLGYKYSAKKVFARDSDTKEFQSFMKHYEGEDDNDRMRSAMTDLAFCISTKVWEEVNRNRGGGGELFFCIGGINAINPFSLTAIKNEVCLCAPIVGQPKRILDTSEGAIYDRDGNPKEVRFSEYRNIYMDFNGSMAFWNDVWQERLSNQDVVNKFKGVFVMGGVLAGETPCTMPSISNVLNRFSSATMNQLYHPQKAAEFFAFLKQYRIDVFTVTNNVVCDLSTFDDPDTKKVKNYKGVDKFLRGNGLTGEFLQQLAQNHYTSKHNPPRKPFDYHTAVALRELTTRTGAAAAALKSRPRTLLYSSVYGMTFVSKCDTWKDTLSAYFNKVDTEAKAEDSAFDRVRKENFAREQRILGSLSGTHSLSVFDLRLALQEDTGELRLQHGEEGSGVGDGSEGTVAGQPDKGDAVQQRGPRLTAVSKAWC